MFVSNTNYKETIESIAEEEGELCVAVAFLGKGAESLIHSKSSGPVKIICNLKSGATNPETIEALRQKGINPKQHDRLHAKVVIGTSSAVIGSANLSSNGLNLEGDETQGWEEAGLVTRDATQLDDARKWFDDMWRDSRDISLQDIEDAKAKWHARRVDRTLISHGVVGFNLDSVTYPELVDRAIYLAIYRDQLSDEAIPAFKEHIKGLNAEANSGAVQIPPMYENWPELPGAGAHLIDIYYKPSGAVTCHGVFTRTYDIKFKNGLVNNLAICREEKQILGHSFRSKEWSQLAGLLKPHIEEIWENENAIGDDVGKYIPLAEIKKILSHKAM
jgi:hypothetical protein